MSLIKKQTLLLILAIALHAVAFSGPENRAALYPLLQEGPLTNPYESLVTGNGDLALSAQVFSHELLLNLGKNDIWDSRIESLTEDAVLKHDELIRLNGDVRNLPVNRNSALTSSDYILKSRVGPTPKPAGFIRLQHPGLSDTKIKSRVDISTGILTVEYEFRQGHLQAETFVHRDKNLVMMKLTARGIIPWVHLIMEKLPDYVDPDMPFPVVEAQPDQHQYGLSQTIPGRFGVEDFTWTVAGTFPVVAGQAPHVVRFPFALHQELYLQDGESVVFTVGVATGRDGDRNPRERAFDLAGIADLNRFEEEKTIHIKSWDNFWSASSIHLEDEELEAMWYRSLFGFACNLKPGAQAPGLNANIPMYDYTGWNGFYTWNHNALKWYFPALPVNHPEWYDVFADLIEQHIPVFEHLAKTVFDLDGVYIDLMTAPFAPPERAKTHSIFGRALAHTGWVAKMLYDFYDYTGNTEWLANRAYPYIRAAAEFYSNYLDKYQQQDGDIYPSMLLEDTDNWYPGFLRSRNVVTDLVMFRKAFKAAVSSSEILGVDKDLRKKWQKNLKRVPEIEYGWKDGRGWYAIYKDWDKAWPDFEQYLEKVQTSRWGNSGWLIYPGENIDGDEEEGLAAAVRDLLGGTDLLNLPAQTRQLGTFHGVGNFMPFIRSGIMEKYADLRTLLLHHWYESGQWSPYEIGEDIYIRRGFTYSWRIHENQYMPLLGITEMLLQSQGGIIRLFPYWPKEKAASFNTLGARGGFDVSAEWSPEGTLTATIHSKLGNSCRIRWTDPETPEITSEGGKVRFKTEGREIVFETRRGTTYELIYH